MKIHHATAKKAQALGITLDADADERYITATSPKFTDVLRDADAKRALVLATVCEVLTADYPGLRMAQIGHQPVGIWANGTGDEPFYTVDDGPLDHDNLLADILEAAEAEGIDAEAGLEEAEEEEAAARVVVAERYKQAYAERGNRNHCGDWLAKTLDGQFDMSVDGVLRFDTDAFTTCLIENGVELVGKWAALPSSGQKGWVGRYRMNGRQRLEFQVAKNGVLTLRGDAIEVPAEDLEELRRKHPKAVAKIAVEVVEVETPAEEQAPEAETPAEKPKAKRSRKKTEKVEA